MIEKDYTHGGNVHKASIELSIATDKIIDFSANINPLGLSPKGRRGMIRGIKNILNYPDPNYVELKSNLSKYYGISSYNCLIGNGAIDLIYSYVRLKSRGRALIPAPGFVEYEKALLGRGWNISLYKSKKDIVPASYDVIFICNPNNPTGESYSELFLLDLLKKSRETGTDIFLDEAFIDYSSYRSMVSYLNEYDNLYILKSLTKFFAIPGLRLGSLLSSNHQFKEKFTKGSIPWSINSMVVDYINRGLFDKKYIIDSKRYIKRERVWLYKELSKIDGVKAYRTQGNYILFKLDRNLDLVKALQKDKILIRSCSNYNNLDSSYYRVAVKKHRLNRVLISKLNYLV